jgi:hypothetical protein
MKKLSILCIVISFILINIPQKAWSQKGYCLGANAGLNSTFVYDHIKYGDVKYNDKLKIGPAFGVAGGYNFTNNFGIEIEANFLSMGQNYSIPLNETHYSENLDLAYMQVPVCLKFSGGDYKSRFSALFGPAFGFLSSAKLTNDSSGSHSSNVTNSFNISDLGIFASAGGDITLKDNLYINLSLRFYVGLNTINKNPQVIMSGPNENETLGNAYAGVNVGIYNLFRVKSK